MQQSRSAFVSDGSKVMVWISGRSCSAVGVMTNLAQHAAEGDH